MYLLEYLSALVVSAGVCGPVPPLDSLMVRAHGFPAPTILPPAGGIIWLRAHLNIHIIPEQSCAITGSARGTGRGERIIFMLPLTTPF